MGCLKTKDSYMFVEYIFTSDSRKTLDDNAALIHSCIHESTHCLKFINFNLEAVT